MKTEIHRYGHAHAVLWLPVSHIDSLKWLCRLADHCAQGATRYTTELAGKVTGPSDHPRSRYPVPVLKGQGTEVCIVMV